MKENTGCIQNGRRCTLTAGSHKGKSGTVADLNIKPGTIPLQLYMIMAFGLKLWLKMLKSGKGSSFPVWKLAFNVPVQKTTL